MTRTLLSMIVAVVAAVSSLPQAAQACISCEHVPEVVRGHRTSDPPQRHRATTQRYNRVAVETRERARARSEAAARAEARREAAAAVAEKAKAKARIAAARARAADAAKRTARLEAERSKDADRADKTTGTPKSVVAQAKAETAEQKIASDSTPVKTNERSAAAVDCKRFVPAAGVTVSVPCS